MLCLLGGFYLFPTVYGALARVYTPDLLLTGRTDTAVLLLPERLVGGPAVTCSAALVTAGAFAAFLSTSSGLTVSVAGVLSQDVLRGSVRDFRLAAALAVIGAVRAVARRRRRWPSPTSSGWRSPSPRRRSARCCVLGIWWRGLTDVGASAGLLAGGGLATAAVSRDHRRRRPRRLGGALLAQPAAWTVPIAFAVMVVVSLAHAATGRARRRPGRWCGCTRRRRWPCADDTPASPPTGI